MDQQAVGDVCTPSALEILLQMAREHPAVSSPASLANSTAAAHPYYGVSVSICLQRAVQAFCSDRANCLTDLLSAQSDDDNSFVVGSPPCAEIVFRCHRQQGGTMAEDPTSGAQLGLVFVSLVCVLVLLLMGMSLFAFLRMRMRLPLKPQQQQQQPVHCHGVDWSDGEGGSAASVEQGETIPDGNRMQPRSSMNENGDDDHHHLRSASGWFGRSVITGNIGEAPATITSPDESYYTCCTSQSTTIQVTASTSSLHHDNSLSFDGTEPESVTTTATENLDGTSTFLSTLCEV